MAFFSIFLLTTSHTISLYNCNRLPTINFNSYRQTNEIINEGSGDNLLCCQGFLSFFLREHSYEIKIAKKKLHTNFLKRFKRRKIL